MSVKRLMCLGSCRKQTKHDSVLNNTDVKVGDKVVGTRRRYWWRCRRCKAGRDMQETVKKK